MAALSGLLVVSLEQALAAPLCSSELVRAGARVIKIERAEGDFARDYDAVAEGNSAYFVWANAGKESLVANIKDPNDLNLLLKIISQADVFIQNLSPGAAERAGLGAAKLGKLNPRLITCDISGYGVNGPYQSMKAYDLLVQCETGLADITGSAESPGRVGVSVCDISCGQYAYAGILEALLERANTGKGKHLNVSLFDSLAYWMNVPYLHQAYSGTAPKRVGLMHPSIAPYGAFTCAGGERVVIAVQNNREWRRLCDGVLEKPGMAEDARFANNPDRVANRVNLDTLIQDVIGALSVIQVRELLNVADVPYGMVNSVAAFADHVQLRTQDVATATGVVSMVAHPLVDGATYPFQKDEGDTEPGELPMVPEVGAHSESIRGEFS